MACCFRRDAKMENFFEFWSPDKIIDSLNLPKGNGTAFDPGDFSYSNQDGRLQRIEPGF